MSFARRQRKQNEENEIELEKLKKENAAMKALIEQKDNAINLQKESAKESYEEIEILKQRVTDLETEVKEVGDPNLFKKYKEMVTIFEDMQAELAAKTFTMTQKEQDYQTLKE